MPGFDFPRTLHASIHASTPYARVRRRLPARSGPGPGGAAGHRARRLQPQRQRLIRQLCPGTGPDRAAALAGEYRQLWARIDRLVFLAAPDWEVVADWREQQEAELRQTAPGAMTPAKVARFIQHYERLTRWMLADLPGRADLTLRLDRQRRVI